MPMSANAAPTRVEILGSELREGAAGRTFLQRGQPLLKERNELCVEQGQPLSILRKNAIKELSRIDAAVLAIPEVDHFETIALCISKNA